MSIPNSSVLLATFLMTLSAAAQTPAPRAIPNEPTCPRCTVTTRTLVTFGTADGVGSLNGKPMSVNVDSRGRYWLFQELEPPTVFNANGTVDRVLGRKGSGPGEYRSANRGVVAGDSMVVFDWMESRATIIGPDLKATRTIRILAGIGDIRVLSWPSLLVSEGYMHGSNPPNSTIHRLSMAGPEMRILDSFGPRGSGGSMGNVELTQIIGVAREGVWSSYARKPHFTRWDRNGVAREVFARRFDWYTGETPASIGNQTTPPTAWSALITEDAEGLLWYFIYRPAPTWKDAWAGVKPFQGHEYRTRDVGFDRLFHTYLEVIDPKLGRVVTRHTINGFVFQTLPDRRVALYRADAFGIPRVEIMSLSLSGR